MHLSVINPKVGGGLSNLEKVDIFGIRLIILLLIIIVINIITITTIIIVIIIITLINISY